MLSPFWNGKEHSHSHSKPSKEQNTFWLLSCQPGFTVLEKMSGRRGMLLTSAPSCSQLAGLAPAFKKWLLKAAISCRDHTISWYFLCNMCLPHYHAYFPLLRNFQFCIHLINTPKFIGHQCPKVQEHLIFGQLAARHFGSQPVRKALYILISVEQHILLSWGTGLCTHTAHSCRHDMGVLGFFFTFWKWSAVLGALIFRVDVREDVESML